MKLTIDTSVFLNEWNNPPNNCEQCPFVYCKEKDKERGTTYTVSPFNYYADKFEPYYDDDDRFEKFDHRCSFTHKLIPYGEDDDGYLCITIDERLEGCPFDNEEVEE